jgi:hypothetical protein
MHPLALHHAVAGTLVGGTLVGGNLVGGYAQPAHVAYGGGFQQTPGYVQPSHLPYQGHGGYGGGYGYGGPGVAVYSASPMPYGVAPAGCGCGPQMMQPRTFSPCAPGRAPQMAGQLSGTMPYSGASISFEQQAPENLRKWVLGFGSTTVAASATAPIVSRPQTWFRPDRLVIPSTQSPNFLVADIKIGNRSQLMNVNAATAQLFIETATDSMVTFDTADGGIDVTLVVTNTDAGAAHAITPTIVGAAAY